MLLEGWGVLLLFSFDIQYPKTTVNIKLLKAGAVPNNKERNVQILSLGGGGGNVQLDLYGN